MENTSQPPLIGANIKSRRQEKGYTLNVLSERSGVSKAMLSQIESEKVNPTVATVWKIARGLDVDINELLEGSSGPVRRFHLTRENDLTVLDTDEEGLHMKVLTPLNMVEDLEMYLLTFSPAGALRSNPHFPRTEEFLTVFEGSIRVTVGEKSEELGAGDFIRYQCDVDHDIENIGRSKAVLHMVVRFHKTGMA